MIAMTTSKMVYTQLMDDGHQISAQKKKKERLLKVSAPLGGLNGVR